jgi:3-hydroxyacyl-[acyl-carrier-protein] dehydratase
LQYGHPCAEYNARAISFNRYAPFCLGFAHDAKKQKKTGKTASVHYNTTNLNHVAHGRMRFILIDRIVSQELGRKLTAVKSVSLAEEYLADHFPMFPVLPGVLLLEGLVESAAWLVRITQDFSHSMVLLAQVRNVKYKSFLPPGSQVEYTVEAKILEDNISSFSGYGVADGQTIVEARFGLRHFNLADRDPDLATVDGQIIQQMKQRYNLLSQQC